MVDVWNGTNHRSRNGLGDMFSGTDHGPRKGPDILVNGTDHGDLDGPNDVFYRTDNRPRNGLNGNFQETDNGPRIGLNGNFQETDQGPRNGLNGVSKPVLQQLTAQIGDKTIRRVSDSEYQREVEIGKAPDTFPCGHTLCHHCIRKVMVPSRDSRLACPICGDYTNRIYTPDPGTSLGYNVDSVDTITLLSNYDDMLKRFKGISYSLRRLRKESVQSRSLGMTFTNCVCDLCEEKHGTLQVLQEFNELTVAHVRPQTSLPHYYYRLSHGEIVTSFYSTVNSSCICVPCTYKELKDSDHFPQLKQLSPYEATHNSKSVLAEVGKIIAKNSASLETLQGKNVIEIDHKILLRERADEFDFDHTSNLVKDMVTSQEENMIKCASYRIQDKGGLYHIKESNSKEQNLNETVVW